MVAAARKGGKRHEVPRRCELVLYLTVWTEAACISGDKKTPLFRNMATRDGRLSDCGMSRFHVFHMMKRRAMTAGLPYSTCCHTFRATGITTYLEMMARWSMPRPSPSRIVPHHQAL